MNRVIINVASVLREVGREEEYRKQIELSPLVKNSDVIDFSGPVEADLRLTNTGSGILVRGRIKGALRLNCSRCLCDFNMPAEIDLQDLYVAEEPDEERFRIVGETIDIGPAVDEGFLLEIPIAPLCDAACKGICPVCGGNLNVEECEHEVREYDERLKVLEKWLKEHGQE